MRSTQVGGRKVSRPTGVMAAPYPSPSPVLAAALDELRVAAVDPPETGNDLRRTAMLPRPWDPASCPSELRRLIYLWLDDVVAWINEEHTWRVDRLIPICWTDHPHIVHDVATVACLRWEAAYAVTPTALEEWHRYTLPMFLERIAQRIGTTGCPPGRHQPNPGAGRSVLYRDESANAERRKARLCDLDQGDRSF
jgi:hypothetical protein